MNWLAHLLLSRPNPEFRVGNLLPDLIGTPLLVGLPAEMMRGVHCHLRIDSFSDRHPVVRRSIRRFAPPFRRFGGIIIDVVYDHLLTTSWPRFSSIPLVRFIEEVHAGFDAMQAFAPAEAVFHLQRIKAANLLSSYQTLEGVEAALHRTGKRLRKPFDLGGAVASVRSNYEEFETDFAEFFPELCHHIQPLLLGHPE